MPLQRRDWAWRVPCVVGINPAGSVWGFPGVAGMNDHVWGRGLKQQVLTLSVLRKLKPGIKVLTRCPRSLWRL